MTSFGQKLKDVEIALEALGVYEKIKDASLQGRSGGGKVNTTLLAGWVNAAQSWSFSSWTSGTRIGVITVPSDATTRYSNGMRVRITQSTGGLKYGIIHKVEATALTVFFQSGATLEDEAITAPHYSTQKAPFGFPMGEDTWSVVMTDNAVRTQATTTIGTISTFTNLPSLSVGIGLWVVSSQFTADLNAATSVGRVDLRAEFGVSTTTNTFAIPRMTARGRSETIDAERVRRLMFAFSRTQVLNFASAVTLNILVRNTGDSSSSDNRIDASAEHLTVLSAISAYI